MRVLSRVALVLVVLMTACGAPAASSPAAAEPAPLGAPSAADTRELSMQVSGLI
jgi:hypothetical protein